MPPKGIQVEAHLSDPASPTSAVDSTASMPTLVAQSSPPHAPSKRGTGGAYRPTPAKTFQCRGFGDCRMVFSRSEHLARHIRKHTGERPFTCHCTKQFSRLDNLRQHAQTVHADKAEENEAMMRELTSLHASMVASHKTSRRRGGGGTSGAAKERPGTATGYDTQYLPANGTSHSSGGKSPHSSYSAASPSYDSSPIDARSHHPFAGPPNHPPSSAGTASAASPGFLSTTPARPNSIHDASPSAQPKSFLAQQDGRLANTSANPASRSASNQSFLDSNVPSDQSFRGSTSSTGPASFHAKQPNPTFRESPTSTTVSSSFRGIISGTSGSFRPSTTSGTEGASFGFRPPNVESSPRSIDSNERSSTPGEPATASSIDVAGNGGRRDFRFESSTEKTSESSSYGKFLSSRSSDTFSSADGDDGQFDRPSTAGEAFVTQYRRPRRNTNSQQWERIDEPPFKFSVPEPGTIASPTTRSNTSTTASTPRPSSSYGPGEQLPPLSSVVSRSALTSRPPSASRPDLSTGMVVDSPAWMDERPSTSTGGMVGTTAASRGLARSTDFRVLPLPSGGGSRPGTSESRATRRLGTGDGSGPTVPSSQTRGDVWRRDVRLDGGRQRPFTASSRFSSTNTSPNAGRLSGIFGTVGHVGQQQHTEDGDVCMGESEYESPFTYNVHAGGPSNPRKRAFTDAAGVDDDHRPTSRRRSSSFRVDGEWGGNVSSRPTTSSGFGFSYLSLNGSNREQHFGGGGKGSEAPSRPSPAATLAALVDGSAAEGGGRYAISPAGTTAAAPPDSTAIIRSSPPNTTRSNAVPAALDGTRHSRQDSGGRYGHGNGLLVSGWSPNSSAGHSATVHGLSAAAAAEYHSSIAGSSIPTSSSHTPPSSNVASFTTSTTRGMGSSGFRILSSTTNTTGWRDDSRGSASPVSSIGSASPSGARDGKRVGVVG